MLIALAVINGTTTSSNAAQPQRSTFIAGIVALLVAILLSPGFFTLQPNEARVLVLFGDYKGSCKQGGLCWGNPFYANGPTGQTSGQSIWNQNRDKLKVNDKRSNPVDIAAAAAVWHVGDTAKAVFDVDDYEMYVAAQGETAVRHLASPYPYDSGETFADTEDEVTPRQRGRGLGGPARGAHRAARAGGRDRRPGAARAVGRDRRPGAPHAPGVRAGDGPARLQREHSTCSVSTPSCGARSSTGPPTSSAASLHFFFARARCS